MNDTLFVPDLSDLSARRKSRSASHYDSLRLTRINAILVAGLIPSACLFTSFDALAGDTDEHRDVPNVLVTEKRVVATDEVLSSKIELPANDLPLSAERLDADAIARIGLTSLGPLLQAATSATAHRSSGGSFNEILLRGFADTPIYRNGINDSKGQLPARGLANIERIEVLKGPYGALFGPGEPGGAINFVTKRPESAASTNVTIGFGSFGEFTEQLDSTGPLVPDTNVDYRFIARREQSDSFRDFTKHDRLFVNPMLAWRANADLRFDATFEYVSDEGLLDTGVTAINGALPLPQNRFLGEPARGPARTDGYTFQVATQYQMSPDWELDLTLNGQKTVLKGKAVEPNELIIDSGRVVLNRSETLRNEQSRVLIAQAEVSGVDIRWNIPHHLVFGFSATGVNEDNIFLASDPDVDPFAINPFAPTYGGAAPVPELERDSHEQTRQFSIYAQDLLRLGERWRVMLGLRFDHIDQSGSDGATKSRFDRRSDEVSPRLGIVFKPTPAWSWFASYSGSVDPNEGLRPDGSGLAPTKSEALEAGVKWQADNFPLSIDASVFAIQQTNVTTDAPGNPGFEVQNGEQESIGVDFEMRAEPASWLSLTTRYTFVDAQILNDGAVNNGTTPLNVAKHQVRGLGLIRGSILKPNDLSLGLSLNYLSERQGSLEPGELLLKLPGYFRGDIFIMWRLSKLVGLELGVENFSNEDYIQGSQSDGLHLTPGEPLTVRGQISLSF